MNMPRLSSLASLWRPLIAACATGLLLAACGGGSDDLDDRLNAAAPQLRLVNANGTPTAPSIALLRNDVVDTESANLAYKAFSNYHDISTGSTVLKLRPALTSGVGPDLASATIDAQRGRKYTVVAVPNGSLGANAVVIDDPYNKPVGNDQARIRVVNASSNAAPVDVYVTAPAADLTALTPNFANVANQAAVPISGNNGSEFTDGTYQVRVTTAGSKTVIFNTTLTFAKNDDLLFVTVPSDPATPVTNVIKLLVVKSDDPGRTATEITTTP